LNLNTSDYCWSFWIKQVLNRKAFNVGLLRGRSLSEKDTFFMMIQDRWWQKFLLRLKDGGKVHAYVLRGAAPPKDTRRLLFYVTKPVGKVAGSAEFIERKVGDPEALWKENGEESVLISKEKYDLFLSGSRKVSFVRFKNLQEAARPISLNDVFVVLGLRRLSRKGFYLNKETADKFITLMA